VYTYFYNEFGVPVNVSQDYFSLSKSCIQNLNIEQLAQTYGEEVIKNCLIASYYKANTIRWKPCSFMHTAETVLEGVAGILSWGGGPILGTIGTLRAASKIGSYVADCSR
jgi:hypothetical protein